MAEEKQGKAEKSEPKVLEGDIVEADSEDYDEDEDGYYATENEEDDEEYEQGAVNLQNSDLQAQARNLASMLSGEGLMGQLSALMGGGKITGSQANYAKGQALQATGDLEGAAEAYLDVIEEDDQNLKAYVALGQVLLAMDNPDQAITFLERAKDLDPDDAGSYLYLGYAYYAKEEFDKCVENFAVVAELEPMHHLAWNNLGFAQYLNKDYEGAIQSFSRAGDIGSERAYYNLGMVRLVQGKEKEGWQSYEDAEELDPHGNQIEEHLPDLYSAVELHPEAAPLLNTSIERLLERAEELGLDLDSGEDEDDDEG